MSLIVHSDIAFFDPAFGILNLCLKKRLFTLAYCLEIPGVTGVVDLEILDSGLFAQGTQATVQIDFDFNSTHHPDHVTATALARLRTVLRGWSLIMTEPTHGVTFPWRTAPNLRLRASTFLAEPKVSIFNETLDATGVRTQHSFFTEENKTDQIRLNGLVGYDPHSERSYVDVVVDDRLPNKFYYGLSDSDRLSMGGEILVLDGMPYANWGETEEFDRIAFTDANGFYAVSELDPGLYNVAVLMEDEEVSGHDLPSRIQLVHDIANYLCSGNTSPGS